MSNLAPFSGEWNFEKAAFLLGRTTFGKTNSQVEISVQDGLESTLDKLFEIPKLPEPPIHYKFNNEPGAPIGSTWVNNYYTKNDIPGLQNARNKSLTSWVVGNIIGQEFSIFGKMILFWHEHFAINNINKSEHSFQYFMLIFENALGNFKNLVKEMTIAPAMLKFLNGDENSKQSPNENYARELLELFTIGRGEAFGTGDYTNYTEVDILAIAKALTGWRVTIDEVTGLSTSYFVRNRHDLGNKELSYRFNNAIIENEEENEYKSVVNIILEKEETARHLIRKLHIWFVGADINDEVEINIISPLAKIIFEDDYDITRALRILLASEYFLDNAHQGCMILSPFDFILKIIKTTDIKLPDDIIKQYAIWEQIHRTCIAQEMEIMEIPTVAGWKAYYQSPTYYQFWINSVSLGNRDIILNALIEGISIGDYKLVIDVLTLASNIKNATNPNDLITGLASIFFELNLSQNQNDYLKEILIPGLPDFEWTIEYGAYLSDPNNEDIRNSVNSKLKSLVLSMMKMPEFQLM